MMNQLCKVCGEPAAGYHFGAFTCEGCKSFFGRTYNNLTALGECKNSGQCVINKKNRTSCKSCRLKKCLMVGMSKSGSRYGRRSNWFKIHYLIHEQEELARVSEHSVFSNGLHGHFQHCYSNKNGSSSSAASPTGTSSPSDTNRRYSPYDNKNPGSCHPHPDSSSPPYEHKDIVFHPLPVSPVSPLSHLHNKFFFRHQGASSSLLSKGLNRFSKMVNGGGLSPGGVATDYFPYHSKFSPVVPLAKHEPVAVDFYADVPEQEKPMDLTFRKSEDSCDTLLDVETFVKREVYSGDEAEDTVHQLEGTRSRETPLDLTKRY